MLSVLDGHLTGPADAEDRGGALWVAWVSSLAITPVLSKGLFTHGPCASLPAEVRQGNKFLPCWQAHNPPIPTHILWVPNHLNIKTGCTRRGRTKNLKLWRKSLLCWTPQHFNNQRESLVIINYNICLAFEARFSQNPTNQTRNVDNHC